jgi:hypothetical protein
MPTTRPRTSADVRRELQATEQRLEALIGRWRVGATTRSLPAETVSRDQLDSIEEVLRQQRGTVDRLHQLWIEYAQLTGHHAPQ